MPKWIDSALGPVALVLLGIYCVSHFSQTIPKDLKSRSVTALQVAGLPASGLDFEGRIAILKGYADSAEVSPKVVQVVRGVNGVFDVRTSIFPGSKVIMEATQLESKLQAVIAGKVIEFSTASAELTPNGKVVLDQMVTLLKEYSQKPVIVSGHTDDEGDHWMNIVLSKQRAESVRAYLITQGIDAGRLFATGHGPDNPVADNSTEEGRKKNRRIEFHVKETL
jgi:outer membrane protein OmpA-like peptidoglycan-associated protein